MKTLSRTIECTKCGCISFPDATLCPRCGSKYTRKVENDDFSDIVELPDELSVYKFSDMAELTWFSYYQFKCPIHGNVDIKATVISPSIKCPFCH